MNSENALVVSKRLAKTRTFDIHAKDSGQKSGISLIVFQDKKIRRIWHNDEWYFVIEDVIIALTDTTNPKQYFKNIRNRDPYLYEGGVQIETPLPIMTIGGIQNKNCANVKGIFRLVQSISSKKAEPFKRWLAQVGYERIQEIENPELAQTRMRDIYKAKGYSDDWVEKRIRGIAIRDELTNEWKNRGIKQEKEYAILTAEISKATFDMTPDEYKKFKGLPDKKNVNLRDHMNDLELIFTMLGDKVTTEITKKEDAKGFPKCETAAKRGGKIAGNARKDTEKELGHSVSSNENYLFEKEKKKKLLKK